MNRKRFIQVCSICLLTLILLTAVGIELSFQVSSANAVYYQLASPTATSRLRLFPLPIQKTRLLIDPSNLQPDLNSICKPDLQMGRSGSLYLPYFMEPQKLDSAQMKGESVVVQHGVYINPQGEAFRIDVSGGKSAVLTFTQNLKVCLDQIWLSDNAIPTPAPIKDDKVSAPTPDYVWENADLEIVYTFLGFVSVDNINAIMAELKNTSVGRWEPIIQKSNPQENEKLLKYSYMLQYIFDPLINRGGSHQYREANTNKAVSVVVAVNCSTCSGSVRISLCKVVNSNPILLSSQKVNRSTHPPEATAVVKTYVSTPTFTYDIGIVGEANGSVYRLFGVNLPIGSGWAAEASSLAPTGSQKNCPTPTPTRSP